MIIDIHAHLVRIDGTYQRENLLNDMDKHSIDKRVVSTLSGRSSREANLEISDFAQAFPDRIIGCAYINPKTDSSVEDTAYALSLPGIRMLELNPYEDGYYPDSEPNVLEIFKLASEKRIPIKVFSGIGAKAMPHQWEAVSKRFPEVTVIYLHMGCFDYGYSCIDIASRSPNALVETSNQYEMQVLRKAFSQLPPEKIVFGSLYPERLTSNGLDIFDLFEIPENWRNKIFSENAIRILSL